MANIEANPELIVEIFKHISPVLIWVETIKQNLEETDEFKKTEFFQLLKQIRNEVSHFDITQNERNESLLIKIVVIYGRFGLNLIEKSAKIRRTWDDLCNDNFKSGLISRLKSKLQNIKIDFLGTYNNHLSLFNSILFALLITDENQYRVLINNIFQYISPIIIWHEETINANLIDSKLLQLVNEIKNRICHLSNYNYKDCTFLKEILKSILMVYKLFGVELKNSNPKISEIDLGFILLCTKHKENDIREDILEFIKHPNDTRRNTYIRFKELIHQFVGIEVPHKKSPDYFSIEINDANEKSIDVLNTSNTRSADQSLCAIITVFILLLIVVIWYYYS